MGLSKAIIAIKGNYLDRLEKVTDILNYMEDGNIFEELSQTAKFDNGWTILLDEEMVFATEDDLLLELSDELETEIFSFVVQSTSATYFFSNFKDGESRVFFAQDGEIVIDIGDKLKEEKGLNINEKVSIDDILRISKIIGIDFAE